MYEYPPPDMGKYNDRLGLVALSGILSRRRMAELKIWMPSIWTKSNSCHREWPSAASQELTEKDYEGKNSVCFFYPQIQKQKQKDTNSCLI